MKCPQNLISKILFILLIFLLFPINVWAKDGDNIKSEVEAVVDLSVCGDGVAEGDEECDENDLNHETCKKIGYEGGDLSCDLSCELDVSSCIALTETPSPTSQPESPANSQGLLNRSSNTNQSPGSIQQQINLALNLLKKIDLKLSLIQSQFDFDSSGKVEIYELYDTVKTWVDEWKLNIKVATAYAQEDVPEETVVVESKKCDLDNNEICNIIDLSILLYYIER